MRLTAVTLTILTCMALAGCSEFPDQGFLTESLGGTIVDAAPSAGTHASSEVYPLHERVGGEDPQRPDDCTLAAQGRADDVKAQGYDEALQKQVYDAMITDCRQWERRL